MDRRMSSWLRIWQITRRLLYQNRWIYLLLMLWPFGMAALLLLPETNPASEDVFSVLHQECLYGLALVAFTGGALLGNEQRSRRIIAVLSRAVSRRQYFVALFAAAWLPLLVYVISFVITGAAMLRAIDRPMPLVLALAVVQLVLGLLTAAAALFFSTWLPMMLASTATLALLALLGGLGYQWSGFTPGRLLWTLTQGDLRTVPALLQDSVTLLALLAAAALMFAAGSMIFERRDLRLKSD
jgi:ABC-type transport system involved in multi-copper enzyme maturation permease subunit